jgi:hypothetical protein
VLVPNADSNGALCAVDTVPPRGRWVSWIGIVAALAIAASLALHYHRATADISIVAGGRSYPVLCDDAYVSMRYARHLVQGHGLVWNVGESPIEGFDAPLWMLWIAGLMLLSSEPSYLVIASGACFHVLSVLVLYGFLARSRAPLSLAGDSHIRGKLLMTATALCAALLLAAWEPIRVQVLCGLEGPLRLLLMVAAITCLFGDGGRRTQVLGALLAGALALVRTDGIVLTLILMAGFAYRQLAQGAIRRIVADNRLALASFLAPIVLYAVFRLLYFGDMHSNAWYLQAAKASVGRPSHAWHFLKPFHGSLTSMGEPPHDRSARDSEARYVLLGLALGQVSRPGTVIADFAAGAVPYFSHLACIDMLGRSDRHIARLPAQGAGPASAQTKFDIDYVLDRKTDLIIQGHRSGVTAEMLAPLKQTRFPHTAVLAENPRFQNQYEALASPTSNRWYGIFLRRGSQAVDANELAAAELGLDRKELAVELGAGWRGHDTEPKSWFRTTSDRGHADIFASKDMSLKMRVLTRALNRGCTVDLELNGAALTTIDAQTGRYRPLGPLVMNVKRGVNSLDFVVRNPPKAPLAESQMPIAIRNLVLTDATGRECALEP